MKVRRVSIDVISPRPDDISRAVFLFRDLVVGLSPEAHVDLTLCAEEEGKKQNEENPHA